MGSNTALCLSRKNTQLALYNRTREKAEKLARQTGGEVYSSPSELFRSVDYAIVFLPRNEDLLEVAREIAVNARGSSAVLVNASTVTPSASLEAMRILESSGIKYVEAPVYGSSSEAYECKLVSIAASRREVFEDTRKLLDLYSTRVFYVGEPPKAMALKLALNNIGLALPAILAESLMILEAYQVNPEIFREVSSMLWLGQVIDRYWSRITSEHPPRFKTELAGKDYSYISETLRSKGLPSLVSDALANVYNIASAGGYAGKDYPYMVNYYVELARKTTRKETRDESR